MRLLLFNLATDADDPVLGFTTRWIEALAQRTERLQVLTMRTGRVAVSDNVQVYSVGKERGYSEPRRAKEFYQRLFHIVRTDPPDVCFSHMMPLFTALAAPILKVKGIPIVTWYAHPRSTWTLRLAHWASVRMVSSVATAYPYRHDKLSVIGQGIDTALFAPTDTVPEEPPVILCTGRLSPVKGHSVLLRTAALLRERRQRPFRVVIVGGPAGPQDASYVQSLHVQRQQLGIDDLVTFSPPVTMSALPVWYQRATIVVNLTPTGFGDKVAWEALSCGRPCVAANEGFRDTFGQYADALCFRHGDAEDLADKLTTLLARPQQELAQMGAYLRQQVVRMHDIERLANRLLEVLQQVSGSPARPQQPNWLGRDASLSHFAE